MKQQSIRLHLTQLFALMFRGFQSGESMSVVHIRPRKIPPTPPPRLSTQPPENRTTIKFPAKHLPACATSATRRATQCLSLLQLTSPWRRRAMFTTNDLHIPGLPTFKFTSNCASGCLLISPTWIELSVVGLLQTVLELFYHPWCQYSVKFSLSTGSFSNCHSASFSSILCTLSFLYVPYRSLLELCNTSSPLHFSRQGGNLHCTRMDGRMRNVLRQWAGAGAPAMTHG